MLLEFLVACGLVPLTTKLRSGINTSAAGLRWYVRMYLGRCKGGKLSFFGHSSMSEAWHCNQGDGLFPVASSLQWIMLRCCRCVRRYTCDTGVRTANRRVVPAPPRETIQLCLKWLRGTAIYSAIGWTGVRTRGIRTWIRFLL
jgi:hypothetical protein